jgi:anti-sigma regulatory factor (Ser/Thr protein kinase)
METLKLTYEIDGENLLEAGEASGKMKQMLKKLGIPAEAVRRASICMYEGEINMVIHANGGTVTVEIGMDEIRIVLKDNGPGIADLSLAMQEGFSTASREAQNLGFGAGMGLPNMKRYSDEMDVETVVGQGTTVKLSIRI